MAPGSTHAWVTPASPAELGRHGGLGQPGGVLPAAKGPPWHPVQPHCSPERVGRAQVRCARLLVGAGAPGPWARRGLAHLDITRLSKRYEEARNWEASLSLLSAEDSAGMPTRLPLRVPLPPPARLSLESVISGPEGARSRIKAWRFSPLCPPRTSSKDQETRTRETCLPWPPSRQAGWDVRAPAVALARSTQGGGTSSSRGG